MDMALGAATILVDAPKEPAGAVKGPVDVVRKPVDVAGDLSVGFGSLKVVLGITAAIHANVSLESPGDDSSIDLSVGNHYHWEQD